MGDLNLLKFFFTVLTIYWFNINLVEGIVGGFEPRRGQFKYTVSLQANGIHIGGGAIVDEMHIVTAARFFLDVGQQFINAEYTIVGGVIRTVEKDSNKIMANVAQVTIPKQYRRFKDETYFSQESLEEALSYDIAIIKLEAPLTFGRSSPLGTVSLPRDSSESSEYVVSGFGYTTRQIATLMAGNLYNWPDRSDVEPCKNCYDMKYTYATAVSLADCSRIFQGTPVTNSHICATVDQKSYDNSLEGLCKGDVGNPLVQKGSDVILGIFMRGQKDCNERNKAGIYTKVGKHLKFIKYVLYKNQEAVPIRKAYYVLKKKTLGKSKKVFVEDKSY